MADPKTIDDGQTNQETLSAVETDETTSIEKNKLIKEHLDRSELSEYKTIEEALGELEEGNKVSIWREKPLWAKCHLGTIEIDVDEFGATNLDLEDLKETYGGHVLKLKFLNKRGNYMFAKTLNFNSIPPKDCGVVLLSPAEKTRIQEQKMNAEKFTQNQDNYNSKMFEMMMTMMMNQNSNNNNNDSMQVKMMKMMMDNQNERFEQLKETKQQANPDPMEQMTKMMTMMETFKSFMNHQDNPEGEQGDDMTKMMLGLMDVVKGKSEQPPALTQPAVKRPQQQPRVVPLPAPPASNNEPFPKYHRPGEVSENDINKEKIVADNNLGVHNDINNTTSSLPDDETLSNELADLDPEHLASIIAETIGFMDDEKQAKVFENFNKIGEGVDES